MKTEFTILSFEGRSYENDSGAKSFEFSESLGMDQFYYLGPDRGSRLALDWWADKDSGFTPFDSSCKGCSHDGTHRSSSEISEDCPKKRSGRVGFSSLVAALTSCGLAIGGLFAILHIFPRVPLELGIMWLVAFTYLLCFGALSWAVWVIVVFAGRSPSRSGDGKQGNASFLGNRQGDDLGPRVDV